MAARWAAVAVGVLGGGLLVWAGAASDAWSIVWPLAAILAVIVIGLLYHATRLASLLITVYDGGLGVSVPGRTLAFRWDTLSSYSWSATTTKINFIPTGTTKRLTLRPYQEKPLLLTEALDQLEALLQIVVSATTPRLLEQAAVELAAGRTLPYGPFELSSTHLTYHSRLLAMFGKKPSLPLGDVERFEVLGGYVVVMKAGHRHMSWASGPIAKIPNPFAFLALLDRLTKATKGNHAV